VVRLSPGAVRALLSDGDVQARLFVYEGIHDAEGEVEFRIPRDAFAHTDPMAVVRLEARLADGEPLPQWLSFDPVSGTFRGTSPEGAPAVLEIALTARDQEGRVATIDFELEMGVKDLSATQAARGDGDAALLKDSEEFLRHAAKPSREPAKLEKARSKHGAASFAQQIRASTESRDSDLAKIVEDKIKGKPGDRSRL
jgi:hypothetical protein